LKDIRQFKTENHLVHTDDKKHDEVNRIKLTGIRTEDSIITHISMAIYETYKQLKSRNVKGRKLKGI
jgi:hypothetical protein